MVRKAPSAIYFKAIFGFSDNLVWVKCLGCPGSTEGAIFFKETDPLKGRCLLPCADFVVCSLCIFYLNSSSSRGLKILWITWFFHATINTCVPRNAVCPGPFLLLRKVHNFKVADRSVDKCRVVRVSSTALRTGRLWAEGGVPLCAAACIQGEKPAKSPEKKEKTRAAESGAGWVPSNNRVTTQLPSGYQAVTKLPQPHPQDRRNACRLHPWGNPP